MTDRNTVTRFAPSPTGYLHVGGARTALFSWLLAKHSGGKFLLRIEDTDLARSTDRAREQLLEDLRWLGLQWDNPVPLRQSQRLDTYTRIIDQMIARGQAYKAYETPEELENQRQVAQREKRAYIYRRPRLTAQQIAQYQAQNHPHVVRFVMPVKEYRFDDVVLGPDQGVPASQVQDFVIRKSDGMPTYHFAVVVDDAEMGITHVLRGQEHLLNTVNHIALQAALGYPRPLYGHLPIILNPDGSKMGKRDRDKKVRHHANLWLKNHKQSPADLAARAHLPTDRIESWLANPTSQLDLSEHAPLMGVVGLKESDLPEILVHDFRKNGYLPEVLLNFLSLLGWSPGGDRQRMSIEEMIGLFDLKDIGKSNARFDRDKLLAFNTEACAQASPPRLLEAMKDFLSVDPDSPLREATEEQLATVLRIKPGFHTLRELEQQSRFFFIADEQLQYDPGAVEKVLHKHDNQGLAVLRDLRSLLAAATQWTAANLEELVKQYGDGRQLGLGKVAQPIRVAVSGTTVSPPIFQSLDFLGRDRTLARIDRCIRECT